MIPRGHRCLALQDYYEWWAANGEVAHAGKPLVIDPEDPTHHHIFFGACDTQRQR